MASIFVTGKIGSGKTYFCAYHALKKYYDYDEVIEEYLPKKKLILVSNIKGLKIDHIDLSQDIAEKGLKYCFSPKYVSDLREQNRIRQVIFIIDEIQLLFDRKFYDKEVFAFFQLSRHAGLDIYATTQDIESVAKEVRTLAEYVMVAVSRSSRLTKSFAYHKYVNQEKVGWIRLPSKKLVFNQYKSFEFEEGEKVPNPVRKWLLISILLMAAAILSFKFLLYDKFYKHRKVEKTQVENKIEKPQINAKPNVISYKEQRYVAPDKQKNIEVIKQSLTEIKGLKKTNPDPECKIITSVMDEKGNTHDLQRCGDTMIKYQNNAIVWQRPLNRRERENN